MRRVDHLVVGAGVAGLAVAWRLARSGREVLVLERATVAAGASGGPGMRGVRANGRDARELPLMARAYRLWPELADEMGHPTGYERTGHLHLTERPEDTRVLRDQADLQSAAGVPSVTVDGAQLRELEPDLSEVVAAAVLSPLDGIADHTLTTLGLAAAARSAGAEVREGEGVAGLQQSGPRLRAVTEQGELVEADGALVAANAGTAAVAAAGGVPLPVFAVFP